MKYGIKKYQNNMIQLLPLFIVAVIATLFGLFYFLEKIFK